MDTEEGRSAERYRRIALSAVMGASARAVGLLTSLISVPLTYHYLGSERYGMWLTMGSIVAMLGPLDLGIGLGLLNAISDADGRNDRHAARRAISAAFVMVTAVVAAAAVVFGLVYQLVPWEHVYNVSSPTAVAEAGPATAVLFVTFAVGLPLGLAGHVQLAYQSGFISSAWAVAGNIGSLLALVAVISFRAGLPLLVAATGFVALAAAAANGWFLFSRQRPWLLPRIRDVSASTIRPLLRAGALFLVLQLAVLVSYQIDHVVIAQILGASAVPEYAVPAKLFALVPLLLSFALTPLWPAYRESLARGDTAWVRRTLRHSILLGGAVNIPAAAALVVLAPTLLNWWVGASISPDPLFLIGLGVWAAMNTFNGPLSMLLNGANVIGFQAACAVPMAAANVLVSVLLVQRIGVAGAIWGTIVAQAVFMLIPQAWYVRRFLIAQHRGQA